MQLDKLKRKFRKLPPYIAVAITIGSTGVAAAAAYGTYQWIKPEVTVTKVQQYNDQGNKQYTIDNQCGEFFSGKALQYEVAKNSGLTDADAQKVFHDSCTYDAIGKFIDAHWVSNNSNAVVSKMKKGDLITNYDHSNAFAGSTTNNPTFGFTLGNVTAISPTSITIQLPLYEVDSSGKDGIANIQYYPQGKMFTRTIPVAPTVQVWNNGSQQTLSTVQIGDQVQLVTRTQNYVKYYQDIHQNALGPQKTFDVAGIIKTSLDPRFIASGDTSMGDPQILNAIAQMTPCDNKSPFLCTRLLDNGSQTIYTAFEPNTVRSKYLRKDDETSKVSHYHLEGRILSIKGNHVVLETRGKRVSFPVDFPGNTLAAYNAKATIKVAVGEVLGIDYAQTPKENHLEIKPADIEMSQLLAATLPNGTIVRY